MLRPPHPVVDPAVPGWARREGFSAPPRASVGSAPQLRWARTLSSHPAGNDLDSDPEAGAVDATPAHPAGKTGAALTVQPLGKRAAYSGN